MSNPQPEGLFDPQKGLPPPDKTGQGTVAAGNDDDADTVSQGDSPTSGSVDGPLAPEPLPGGVEAEGESEMRPRENDPRKSDGVETFRRMETATQRQGQDDSGGATR